mmetsp:Transcript_8037/g.21304  ORF Transcript_8037/g.21304 Transcript_8037/m.21304 type:complete len:311 (+) Transcript_8037:195-1127(+)
MESPQIQTKFVADAPSGNFVDLYAPASMQPYLRLMRVDRPVGIWLLVLPFCWAVALAGQPGQLPDVKPMLLFFAAATALRGGGCALNDIADRDLDAKVARTKNRPLACGQIGLAQAWVFALGLLLVGTVLMAMTNAFTVMLTASSLVLVAMYPLMKRVTWWPQAFLGITFNWSVLLGWSAVHGSLSVAAVLMYAAGALWTFGYDTLYAHQDKVDDAKMGMHSSALRLGSSTKKTVGVCYGLAVVLLAASMRAADIPMERLIGLVAPAAQLLEQVLLVDLESPASCLLAFKASQRVGVSVLVAVAVARGMP